MNKLSSTIPLLLFLLLRLLASCSEKQVYIVYLGENRGAMALQDVQDSHHSYLMSVNDENEVDARDSLLYSYKHSFNGFAAVLSPEQAAKLSERGDVVSVMRSDPNKYSMHTTRSWEFSGLDEGEGRPRPHAGHGLFKASGDLLAKAGFGKDVIVGVLDSGVWPESKSFSDQGMGPIPKSWKGICQTGDSFNSSHCNRKLIGARYYIKGFENFYGQLNRTEDYRSPRDKDGHGTHTASTVGGRSVANASALGGFAAGMASGGAPLARLAIYKVCWAKPGQSKADGNTCFMEDMLAAMDEAVADGVHVISISIGTNNPVPYADDGIAIGALHAVKRNVVVACSAGNSGPHASTLSNPAPWIITVGASSVDRQFLAPVLLGNGLRVEGQTVTPSKLDQNKMYPLAYAADLAKPGVPRDSAKVCLPDTLSPEKAKGKIVLCMRGNNTRVGKGIVVKKAGGAGYILANTPESGSEVPCDAHFLPATSMSYTNALKVIQYINSTRNPVANIAPARTVLHTKPAPFMAGFTSRGPNIVDPNILKPDITAPGLNILAAWTEGNSPTKLSEDPRIVQYNILSGTSMSCPHIAATAALLRAIHPTWSSAAIRSAIMTTAGLTNNMGSPLTDSSGGLANSFSYGSGHFRPSKAADPGLVYDASYEDYLRYLCSVGINNANPSFKCPKSPPVAVDLNYPSVSVSKLNGTAIVRRAVTNVGKAKSVYFFSSNPPAGFSVQAKPSVLSFPRVGQKKSFKIIVKARNETLASKRDKEEYAFGWFTWSDGPHLVRSPIVVSLA